MKSQRDPLLEMMEHLCCGGRCQSAVIHEGGCECGIYREEAMKRIKEIDTKLDELVRSRARG